MQQQDTTGPGHFNPRSSCEERLTHPFRRDIIGEISIHAPHARSDQSEVVLRIELIISIHAPHARSDVGRSLRR